MLCFALYLFQMSVGWTSLGVKIQNVMKAHLFVV